MSREGELSDPNAQGGDALDRAYGREYLGPDRAAADDGKVAGGHFDHVDKLHPGAVQPADDVEIVLVTDLGILGAQAGVKAGIALGNGFASAQERLFIEGLLSDEDDIATNTLALWQTLLKVPAEQLQYQQRRTKNSSALAWLELALIHHNHQMDIGEQAITVSAWRDRWPQHYASKHLPRSIDAIKRSPRDRPNAIAALLPLSGPLAAAGKAAACAYNPPANAEECIATILEAQTNEMLAWLKGIKATS